MIELRSMRDVRRALAHSPAVALLGPRQGGKTTLALQVAQDFDTSIYLDLERQSDRRTLEDVDAFLRDRLGTLVILDVVHRVPHLFETLRGVIDEGRRQGHRAGEFLLLGSASPALLGMGSEILAGRLRRLDRPTAKHGDAGFRELNPEVRGGCACSRALANKGGTALVGDKTVQLCKLINNDNIATWNGRNPPRLSRVCSSPQRGCNNWFPTQFW